ncbi:hypothetical protein DNTS_002626 [Danionella cerebrum]|uniref:G-protein coupled receptors family 2 profile 2 domain-containing protein n=1 Tax=Danionella cerebrum TaxID=2873325 RepID=A0A553MVF4_9TELE|nr:hypothetical protein DNTS_002626 [Danionella translucida]
MSQNANNTPYTGGTKVTVSDYGDAFYRVYVNVTINGTITDSKHTIERWVQALAPVNVTATATLIYELLSEGYANDTISITVPPCEINISQIDPGLCPEEPLFTVYGFYNWPSLTAQSTYEMGCVKGGQSATRFCSVALENSEDIVDMIEDLLNGQTDLNDAQLDIVLEKLSLVTEVGTLTPDLSSSIAHIVSDVCQITTNPPKVTNKILFITELMGDRTVFEGDAYNMTAPALALQLINPDTSPFHGLRFQVSSLRNDSTPEIYYDENFKEDPDTGNIAFISLPSTIENFFPSNGANPRVQFQFFAKENFFKDPSSNMSLNSYVVSASVTNASVSSLEMPVMVTLRHLQHKEDGSIAKCVFWDFSQNMNQGGWNETGCETVTSNATYTSCSCDHLTHFGVLLDISKTPISQKDERILTVISNLGCGISSIFLGVTLLTYLAFEKLRRDYPSKILINLSVALLGLNMLFLVNSWFASFNNRALCITTAAFQHYFFLASFTWMGLGAINMYLALVKVFNSYVPSYILKFCAVGWGLPFLIVGLVLAIDVNSYGRGLYREVLQETAAFCWIQKEDVFYATVLAFAVLVLVCNFIVFSVVMVQIRRMHANKTSSARKGFLHDLRVVASLTFLLGLTWILVFFGWGPAKTPLMYMFSLLNSLQGFFIFLFYCLMKDNVRKQWRTHLCCGRFKLTEYSDWNSHSVAMGAKAKVGPKVSGQSMKSENTSERKISDTSNSGESTESGFLKDRTQ